jgi:predicted NBD/HSP70 family sugar kinase
MSSGLGIETIIERELKRKLTIKNFFRLYNSDNKIKEIIKRIKDYNAQGIGNMLNAFSVDLIVLMGSIALNQFNKVIPSSEEIKKYTINNKIPKIVPTNLGDNIGLLGTFVFALENLNGK